jgi:hypothetical protein
MIKLRTIVESLLRESLSFSKLMSFSDPIRKDKAKKMRTRSLPMRASSDEEYWNFAYKSDPSHITKTPQNPNGISHVGRITFKKNNEDKSAIDLPCSVDCNCNDFKYKWAYANNDKGSAPMGNNSLNKCNGATPRVTNPYLTPGLCKHLLSLKEFLRTKLNESQHQNLSDKLDEVVSKYPESYFNIEE